MKHISSGVKLSNYPPFWVNDGALERQWVLWTARSKTAVLLQGWGLVLAVWQRTGNRCFKIWQLHNLQTCRRWSTGGWKEYVQFFVVCFFLRYSDKKWFSLNEIELCGFWCNIMSVNSTLKSRWKGKALWKEWRGEKKKTDWNYTSRNCRAAWSVLHHRNGLQCWAEKQIELQLRRVLWCVLVCHIKEEQRNSLADGCTMSQACLSEATDAGT